MSVFKKRGNWYIDYYFQGRRIREKIGQSKTLAEHALMKKKVEIAEGKFLDIKKKSKIKFENFSDEFYKLHCEPNHKEASKWAGSNLKVLKKIFFWKVFIRDHSINCSKI